jgi:hypothetical protein
MLVLQQLFNLSDNELEFQVNDKRSFEEFVGLGVMNSIPDATTVAFFRERLRRAGVIEELLRCSRNTCALRVSKPVVVRSLTRLSSLFPSQRLLHSSSNAIPARRTKKSKPEDCRRVGMKTQTACSKKI